MNKDKKIKEVKNEMENLKKDFDKNYLSLEAKLKKLEKGTYEVGDEVKYKGLDWIVIKVRPKAITLMLKNKLNKEQLKKCECTSDNYNDIAFNTDHSNNDWKDSDIRKCVINFANEYLNVEDLINMRTNYDEDKYSDDFIRIPTLREIEAFPKDIRKIDASSGYWTMTASYGETDTDSNATVFFVNTGGGLNSWYVNNTLGVRPVITLNAEAL